MHIYNFLKPLVTTDTLLHENGTVVQSYSQTAEDLIVDSILGCKSTGVYVDIGANNPNYFNNTRRFYDRGWSGINIEPHPKEYQALLEYRKRDINLHCGVSDQNATLPYHVLDQSMVSTFGKDAASIAQLDLNAHIVDVIEVPVMRLDTIFDKHLDGRGIDFMSIDVEGSELNVLKGNNWEKYRPKVIIIETCYNVGDILSYLIDRHYTPVFRNAENGIFVDTAQSWHASLLQ